MTERKPTHIAVIYATAQGSTREIAEFMGANFAARGAIVEVADTAHAPDLSRFDVVILGSAVHDRALLPDLDDYAGSHLAQLTARDVWLFSVGLGPALRGPAGSFLGHLVPKKIAAVRDAIGAHEYRAFAGHYERAGVSLGARTLYRLFGGLRYGDLRDWSAIGAWTDSIAHVLKLPAPRSIPTHP